MRSRMGFTAAVVLVAAGGACAGGVVQAQGAEGSAPGQGTQTYAVATLAPEGVTVPPVLLEDADLHATLVELAAGTKVASLVSRLGLDADEVERLLALAEVEALGRQTPEGWKPLALALDADGADSLATFTAGMAVAIADSLEARWAWLDSMLADLPVTGRLPLAQTGHILLGGYLLGLYQADAFWAAGLAPSDRPYAFRVYRMPLEEAPSGHFIRPLGQGGWVLDRFAPDGSSFGLARLSDPADPLIAGLLAEGAQSAEGRLPEERERFLENVLSAYRVWYLLERQPDSTTRLLLERLEAVDADGLLRVPLISAGDRRGLRSMAATLAEGIWPVLRQALPGIGELASELGYGEPRLLGEVALWTWERAAQTAVDLLVERGRLLPPPGGRSQALLLPPRP